MTATGNPVFETVGGDVSAATVSADGGKTSQTLAALAQGQNALAGNIADVAQDAADAKAEAAQAASDVADAKSSVSDLEGKAVTTDKANVANGYAALDASGSINIPGGWISLSREANTASYVQMADGTNTAGASPFKTTCWYSSSDNTTNLAFNFNNDGTRNPTGSLKGALCPDGSSTFSIGRPDNYWVDLFLQNAPTVVSDANNKTIAGSFDDLTYEQAQKLSDAVFSVAVKIFQLNSAITEKGADKARFHIGLIAQEIEAAITAAGLDPAKYAMWTNTPVYQLVKKDSGKKDANGKPIMVRVSEPVYEADGKTQKTQQMLRYEQVLCTLFAGAKSRISTLIKDVSDLTTRVAALETKSGGAV